MDEEAYRERIAAIRSRFAARLFEEISMTVAVADDLTSSDPAVINEIANIYRRFHSVGGIGGTIGFDATGHAARTIDAILIDPFRDKRRLTVDEVAELKKGLDFLGMIARTECVEHTGKELAS